MTNQELSDVDELRLTVKTQMERIAQLEQALREHGICPQCGIETNGMPFHTCKGTLTAQKEGKS